MVNLNEYLNIRFSELIIIYYENAELFIIFLSNSFTYDQIIHSQNPSLHSKDFILWLFAMEWTKL